MKHMGQSLFLCLFDLLPRHCIFPVGKVVVVGGDGLGGKNRGKGIEA